MRPIALFAALLGAMSVVDAQVAVTPANPAYAARVLASSTTLAQTAANTTETDLWTYTMPANTLSANGKSVRITVYGTTAANANNKVVRLYFGATLLRTILNSASNNETWQGFGFVMRSGAATEIALSNSIVASAVFGTSTGPTENTASDIVIKVTGQNGVATAGDIVFRGAVVELLPF